MSKSKESKLTSPLRELRKYLNLTVRQLAKLQNSSECGMARDVAAVLRLYEAGLYELVEDYDLLRYPIGSLHRADEATLKVLSALAERGYSAEVEAHARWCEERNSARGA